MAERREHRSLRKRRRGAAPVPDLDRLIHERIRLGMISALAVNDSLLFADLKSILQTSDGNLSVHARKLEDAGYLKCRKYFQGRVPQTEYSLTERGRRAFEKYLDNMEHLIESSRGVAGH